jgi:sRNA-binding protein
MEKRKRKKEKRKRKKEKRKREKEKRKRKKDKRKKEKRKKDKRKKDKRKENYTSTTLHIFMVCYGMAVFTRCSLTCRSGHGLGGRAQPLATRTRLVEVSKSSAQNS